MIFESWKWSAKIIAALIAVLVNSGCVSVQDQNNYRPQSQARTGPYMVECSDRAPQTQPDIISDDFYTCSQKMLQLCTEAHDSRRWCRMESIRQRCRCQYASKFRGSEILMGGGNADP
jgi:hypothetical protein